MSMLIGRLAKDGLVALLQYFLMGNSNFVKSKKDAYMFLQPAHFNKTEVRDEERFEVPFGKLLSI